MSFVKSFLKHFLLKPKSLFFFYVLAGMHIFLKFLLGLVLVFKDGYGFFTLVSPPQSIFLASSGVVLSYIVAKLMEIAVPERYLRRVQIGLLFIFQLFLIANFITHSYFKSFINYGLIMFNGAGVRELFSYFVGALNIFSVSFIALTVVLLFLFVKKKNNLFSSAIPSLIMLLISLVMWPVYGENFGKGIKGWLVRNPLMDLVDSTLSASGKKNTITDYDDSISEFKKPEGPVYGKYSNNFDFEKPALKKPNVLFILTESLPKDKTPMNPEFNSPMPTIKSLMQRSIVFPSFYTVFPATSRSFISYHCGMYPNSGYSTITKYRPDFDCDSITGRLKNMGYKTGFFTASMFTYDNMHKTSLIKSYGEYKDFFPLQSKAKHNSLTAQAVEEEVVVAELLDFLKKDRDKPFFATYFAFWDHSPYHLPFRDISHLSKIDQYRETLKYLDDMFDLLLKEMEKEGLLENTIVVFAADHGEGFGVHGNYNHVGHVYQDDINIPFMISLPGQKTAVENNRLGSNVDFATTLFSLMGLEPSESWQGQDLLSKDYVTRPKLFFSRSRVHTNGIIDGNYKYFYNLKTGKEHLYDLAADPGEKKNLLKEKNHTQKHTARSLINGLNIRIG